MHPIDELTERILMLEKSVQTLRKDFEELELDVCNDIKELFSRTPPNKQPEPQPAPAPKTYCVELTASDIWWANMACGVAPTVMTTDCNMGSKFRAVSDKLNAVLPKKGD